MDNLQKIDHSVKRSAIISIISLFAQSGYAAVLGLGANLAVTILLTPGIYGIYITVLSMIAILNYFSDIGLAASLIQKKELTQKDIATTFTVQQFLIISLVVISLFATPYIIDFYKLPQEGTYLYWAVLFGFFLSSLKTIPSVFLERKVQFQKIVFVQVVENTLFYLSVIIFAVLGFGLNSFTISVIIRSIVGVTMMYSISFWRPSFGFSMSSFKELVSFGLPFQGSSFLALFKDDFIILFLGKVVGFEILGYIGWAKKWAEAPIRIVMDNVGKVMFPVIARLQDQKIELKKVIEKIFFYQSLIVLPALTGAILLMEDLIQIIPKYAKWQGAVPIFYIFVISSAIVSLFAPLVAILNALGKAKTSFLFMAFFTILTWVLTPVFVLANSFYGFPIAHLIVSSSYIILIFYLRKIIEFDFFKSILPAIVSSIFMGTVVYFAKIFIGEIAILQFIFLSVFGIVLYYFSLLMIFKVNLNSIFFDFFSKIKSK